MTTAARPTFDPARGNDNKAPSFQYSARDLASHTKLKFRQPGQGTTDEIGDREQLLEELRRAEREYFEEKAGGPSSSRLIKDQEEKNEESPNEEKQRLMAEAARLAQLDKDDSGQESDSDDSSGSSSSSEDDDDDDDDNAAELLATLQRIRKERAEEKERQEREARQEAEAEAEKEAMSGNPLLNIGTEKRDFTVKRRWDDDVIFKNQAKGLDDKPKKRFVNDMLRSDFHRKFLHKYIH
ncbi:Pre-mRNA-splicing factor Cwf15/Cwc15 [Mycotypha africana]|uniref:Pre-mRNA-splicing factor Cwf15/Cwc15 n=1 Tax=Mycotypha africana TaxID=64632 RepID=UPI002301FA1F|nr:Pre-mRNA-splicing factor Cwf15/Cwc15 [Mycotypha africana]KAI8971574.1 Pre-mRNA-splicing factor Cwf15/Cwc15 [Mycotypha africana]